MKRLKRNLTSAAMPLAVEHLTTSGSNPATVPAASSSPVDPFPLPPVADPVQRRRSLWPAVTLACSAALDLATRLSIIRQLESWIANPDDLRKEFAKSCRRGVVEVWSRMNMRDLNIGMLFSNAELGDQTWCDESSARRAIQHRAVKSRSLEVLLNVLIALDVPFSRLHGFPTSETADVAAICEVAAQMQQHLGPCNIAAPIAPMTIRLPIGIVLSKLVRHPDVCVLCEFLPCIQLDPCQMRGNQDLMSMLEDCISATNRQLDTCPPLKRLVGAVEFDEIDSELGQSLRFLEGWFFAEELMLSSRVMSDNRLLGIFV